MRKPGVGDASTLARSSSSAWAPSIASSAGREAPVAPRAPARYAARSAADADEPERARRSAPRARRPGPRGTARGQAGCRQVARRPAARDRERDHVVAAVVVALDVEVARRLAARPSTWSATLPSISRGTSRWPRSPRTSRSRPNSSESACRSTTPQRRVERLRALGAGVRAGDRLDRAQPAFDPADPRRSSDRAAPRPRRPTAAPRRERARRAPSRHAPNARAARRADPERDVVDRRHLLGESRTLAGSSRRTSRGTRALSARRRRRLVDPRLALDDDDVVAASPSSLRWSDDPRVVGEVVVALRAPVAVDAGSRRRPTGTRSGRSAAGRRRDRREPADHVGREATERAGVLRVRRVEDPVIGPPWSSVVGSSGRGVRWAVADSVGDRRVANLVEERERAGVALEGDRARSRAARPRPRARWPAPAAARRCASMSSRW